MMITDSNEFCRSKRKKQEPLTIVNKDTSHVQDDQDTVMGLGSCNAPLQSSSPQPETNKTIYLIAVRAATF